MKREHFGQERQLSDVGLEGFNLRAPTMDDALAVTELMNACDVAVTGKGTQAVQDTRAEWRVPSFDLVNNAWVVLAPDGQVVGYEQCVDSKDGNLDADGYVRPGFEGRGIGTALLRLAERRAWEHMSAHPPEQRISLLASCFNTDVAAQALFTAAGFRPIRYFWRMDIDMQAAAPVPPAWPEGIAVRAFVQGQDDRSTHAAVSEAFMDHWNFTPWSFEDWAELRLKREDFDPTLWFLAIDQGAGEIAGMALCRVRLPENIGWVQSLSVRRPWRKQGLGMALLRHSFWEFYQRGFRQVGLGVDAQNLTGATRLYERAGMKVTRQADTFEKELRPGRRT